MQEIMSAAKEVVVLLNRDFRISRNIRLKWYFDHLNLPASKATSPHSLDNEIKSNSDGLQVVFVLPFNSEEENDLFKETLFITTDTKITFLSSGYRFVFGLDLSASLLRVDTFQNFVMLEAVLVNFQMCLESLLESYSMEEGITVKPDIYITVFAQWHGTKSNGSSQQDSERVSQKVLIQGCHLTEDMIPIILEKVKKSIYNTVRMDEPGRHKSALQNRDDILIGILRTGLLALRLLPSNTSSGVVIITDGVLGEPNPTSLERLLRQCQNTTTSCSFIHVNPSASPLCDFGCISNVELMQFIANSTKGQYINVFSSLSSASVQSNIYQQALLPWTFQVKSSLAVTHINTSVDILCNSCSSFELRNVHASPIDDPVLLIRKQDERTIKVDIVTVVSARLREGYEIKSTKIVKNKLEIILVLQWWKNFTTVEYRVSSAWPMQKSSCKVEVYISGTYEFLLDVSKHDQSRHWTRPRKTIVHRLLRFFQDLMHSDHMLQYLRGFTTDPTNYTISDSLRQGQTLYYLPPNSFLFELSTQVQHIPSSFSSYWKPILSLDVNIWQQWLHIHRIEVVLQHDVPLPKHLHMISSSGRHSVQCRVAFSQMVSMLRDWCTFVLLENHTYVKFIYTSENVEKPFSFFLVRLSTKSPAMVLKLAFLIGLSGKVRKHYVCELRERVVSLVLPNSGSSSGSSTKRVRHASSRLSPNVKPHRPFHSASDRPCVMVMHKPVDQVLVRYVQVPEDYLSNFSLGKIYAKPHSDVNEQFIRMRDMQWYLQHQRYVWSLTNNLSTPLSIDVACHLASLLLKIRLTEGYQIAYSSSGMVNLTREFPMQTSALSNEETVNDYCLVQFVIFPPKFQVEDNSNSAEDTDEEDAIEDSPINQNEIVFAVEVWVEPQYGFVKQKHHQSTSTFYNSKSGSPSSPLYQSDNLNEVPYYEGLSCNDIITKVLEQDSICVCNVVTLEHLQLMCTSNELAQTLPQKGRPSKTPSYASTPQECSSPYHVNTTATDHQEAKEQFRQSDCKWNQGSDGGARMQYFPCIVDLVMLLDQSPRIRHLFMTLAKEDLEMNDANATLFTNFHKSLKSHCDCTISLTKKDQDSITKHMISRRNGDECKFVNHLFSDMGKVLQGSWSCYLKQGGNGQVFVIILPATYSDFLSLFSILAEEPAKDTNFSKQSKSASSEPLSPRVSAAKLSTPENVDSADSTKVHRRLSFKRLASSGDESASFQPSNIDIRERTLPVFIYNCSMQMLVSGFLNRAKNSSPIKWPDSLQDHRVYTDDIADIQSFRPILSSKDSPSTPKSATFDCSEQNDDVFSLTSPENNHLQNLGRSVVEFYHRSFVVGVFSAVQAETKSQFSTDDLLISTDYFCNESVHEIDITDFILLNCPQVTEFKNQNFNPSIADIDPQTTEAFESDELDIEDMCTTRGTIGHNVVHIDEQLPPAVSQDLVEVACESTAAQKNVGVIVSKAENDTFLQQTGGDSSKAETASFVLSNFRKSAFTTVQRTLRSRASECENFSLISSSSEEEAIDDREARKKTVLLHKRERKAKSTLPVKRVASHKHTSVCLPAGWNNLPEFPVSVLNVPHTRHQSGSSEQVERYFTTLLQSYCHAVPAIPFLYYAVNANDTVETHTPKLSNQQTESDTEDVQFVSDAEYVSHELQNKESVILSDSLTHHLSLPCFEDNDSSMSSENGREINPLFLYMTCTVRDKKTGNCGSTPVKCLPINLKYVLECLEKPCETIDLSQIKITLDLIWMFLPPLRTSSSVPTLPLECTSFVTGMKHSIEWLLNDEIISSLRTSEPINTTTLTKVSDHVRTSDSSNCVMFTTPLQFIFGVEKSRELLCSEFEKLKLENYKLKKEGQFYFLSLERAFLPISNSSFMNVNKDKTTLLSQQDNETMKEKSVPESGENARATFNISFSPKANPNKSIFLPTINSEYDSNGMQAPIVQNEPSSSMSLTAIESDCMETPKFEYKIKKASSSSELLSCTVSTRRCTSVSSIPLVASTSKESYQPTPLSVNKSSVNFPTTPSSVIHHQHLRISLSTGKDSIGHSPLNIPSKNKPTSVPVTPLDHTNVESEKFVFSSKGDGRQSCGLSRDPALSPSSEYSPRQFSQTSWLGSGYEGEESDCEDEEDYRERLEEGWSQLPNFWLIICIEGDIARVSFHRRSSAKVIKPVALEHDRIFKSVCQNLTKACRAVNQILLLKILHDSRLCHSLLVEESPENIWKRDDYPMIYHNPTAADGQVGEDTQSRRNDYLAANMDFPPGYFECVCVLQQCIVLYHSISSGGSGGAKAFSALQTVRSLMKNFTVVNQQNMFVYQVPDGTVYYCRMYEEGKKADSNGRRSSLLFQNNESNTATAKQDYTSQNMLQIESEPKLFISWYGVHALTQQHLQALEELKEGIIRKLNDAALDCITVRLNRNPQYKLTPADVLLIQPRQSDYNDHLVPKAPDDTVSFSLPPELANKKSMSSLVYYIHQNLLLFLVLPRYTEPNSAHFLPHSVNDSSTRPLSTDSAIPGNLYLFSGLKEKGRQGQGIACVCLDFNCKNDSSVPPLVFDSSLNMKRLKSLIAIENVTNNLENQATVYFHFWSRGSVKATDLHDKLQMAVQHAVCDAIMEQLLRLPFTPIKLVKTDAMKNLFEGTEKKETPFLQNLFPKFGNISKTLSQDYRPEGKSILPDSLLDGLYDKLVYAWFAHMKSISCPTVSVFKGDFKSVMSLEQGIQNISDILYSVLVDSEILTLCKPQNSEKEWKFTKDTNSASLMLGKYYQWMLLSRNFNLWKKTTGVLHNVFTPNPATSKIQKFLPFDSSIKPDASPCPQHTLVMSSSFIPRQHFAYVTTENASFKIYLYNVSDDKCNKISQKLHHCTKFHNARHDLLQNLTLQKLGLFKHVSPKETHSSKAPTHHAKFPVDFLIKHNKVPVVDKRKFRFTAIDQNLDDLLLDVPHSLYFGRNATEGNDTLSQVGHQCTATLRHKRALKDARKHLDILWRRSSSSICRVSSATLDVILSFARLIHSASSPVLLDSFVRQEHVALFMKDRCVRSKSELNENTKQQTVLSRTSSFLGTYRRRSGDSLHKTSEKLNLEMSPKESKPDICRNSFDFMSNKFTELYAEHWKGFVKLEPQMAPGNVDKKPDLVSQKDQPSFLTDHFLYRALAGGIILIVHTFLPDRFDVKLYCIDMSSLHEQTIPSKQKTRSFFIRECEKVKRHMEVHLFSLEMHLRCVQWYLNGNHSLIRSGYNFIDLMNGLTVCYGALLDDFQSQVYQGVISIPCSPVNCHDLYDFIIENASVFGLKTLCVRRSSGLAPIEHILFTSEQEIGEHTLGCSAASHDNYNICSIVSKSDNSEPSHLKLSYFILISHKRMPSVSSVSKKNFPEAIMSAQAQIRAHFKTPDSQLSDIPASPQQSKKSYGNVQDELLPVSLMQEVSCPSFLVCEKTYLETMLCDIGSTARTECYRHHHLWKGLVQMCNDKVSGKPLNLVEFQKLLDCMELVSASEFDLNIGDLLLKRKNIRQGQNAQKRLLKKFSKVSTTLSSSDSGVQHVCILSPQDVHVMAVLTVDINRQDIDLFLVKPRPEFKKFHTGDSDFACKELLLSVCDCISKTTWLSWL